MAMRQTSGEETAPSQCPDGGAPQPDAPKTTAEDSIGNRNGEGSDTALRAMLRDRERAAGNRSVDIPLSP